MNFEFVVIFLILLKLKFFGFKCSRGIWCCREGYILKGLKVMLNCGFFWVIFKIVKDIVWFSSLKLNLGICLKLKVFIEVDEVGL